MTNGIGYLDELLYQIAQWLANAVQTVLNGLYNAFSGIALSLKSMLAGLIGALDEAFSGIVQTLRTMVANITAAFSNIIAGIQNALQGLWQALYDGTVGILNKIGGFVTDLIGKVSAAIGAVVDKLKGFIDQAFNAVKDLATKALEALTEALAKIVNAILDPIEKIFDRVTASIKRNEDIITEEWKKLVAGSESLLVETEKTLTDLGAAFDKAAKLITSAVSEASKEAIKEAKEFLTPFLADLTKWLSVEDTNFLSNKIAALTTGDRNVAALRDIMAYMAAKISTAGGVFRGIFIGLLAIIVFLPFLYDIGAAAAQVASQEFALTFPYELLSPAEAIEAWRHEIFERDIAVDLIRRKGFSQTDANTLVKISDKSPDPSELLTAWRRHNIDDEVLRKTLFHKGFPESWQKVMREDTATIPSIGDLMSMATHGAFGDEVLQLPGSLDEFSGDVAVWADKNGLDMEWTRRYWASHWTEPGLADGLEMLHRRVIDRAEFMELMKRLDIHPAWRERLIQVAYLPLNRLDLRRMHSLGQLSDEDVFNAYRDIGYDEVNAKRLTQLTIAINAHEPTEDSAQLVQLARNAVLDFYHDGVVSRPQAYQILVQQGYTTEGAETYLESIDVQTERENRAAEIGLITERAATGQLTYEQAQDQLNRLNLSTTEVTKALIALERTRASSSKLPSKADADAFFRAGIIGEPAYRDLLDRIGYAPQWIDAYVQLIRSKASAANKPEQTS